MKRFMHFLQYHNAALLILVVVFGAGSAVFASSEEARDAVLDVEEKVVSYDNTYLLATDLDDYDYNVRITSVKTDDEYYYIDYEYSTIELIDNVWQTVDKTGSMKPTRKSMIGRDLGVYVATQLGEVIDRTKDVLVAVQDREADVGERRVVIATEYRGLIGKMLNTKTKELPGYVPVFKPKPKPEKVKVTAGPTENSTVSRKVEEVKPRQTQQIEKATNEVTTIIEGQTKSAAGAPEIEILGANPARIPVGSSYADWGVRIYDDKDEEDLLQGWLSVTGANNLDTSEPATFRVRYSVTDTDDNTSTAVRVVEVYDQYVSQGTSGSSSGGSTGGSSTTASSTDTSSGGGENATSTDSNVSTSTAAATSTDSGGSTSDTTATTTEQTNPTETDTSTTETSTATSTDNGSSAQDTSTADTSSTETATATSTQEESVTETTAATTTSENQAETQTVTPEESTTTSSSETDSTATPTEPTTTEEAPPEPAPETNTSTSTDTSA